MVDSEDVRKVNAGIAPIQLPGICEFRDALKDLDWAESDIFGLKWIIRVLTREAITSIGNALDLFGMGYCDAACFALRQAVELTTVFVYFDELDAKDQKRILAIWENSECKSYFPPRSKIEKELSCKLQRTYADLKIRMPNYFLKVDEINGRLNKYIHKQGYEFLYESRRLMSPKELETVLSRQEHEYVSFVETAISLVALMKLTVDPMPLILADEKLANRLPGVIALPYSEGFKKRYLGGDMIKEFKQTEVYKECERSVLMLPANNKDVYALKNDFYFDRKTRDSIFEQIGHITFKELLVVACASMSMKVSRLHYCDGVVEYLTDVRSNREPHMSFSTSEFKKIRQGKSRRNVPYRGVFLTLMDVYDGDTLFIEHNEKFEDSEFLSFCEMMAEFNAKAKECDKDYLAVIEHMRNRMRKNEP